MDKATDAGASTGKLDGLSIRGFRGIDELDIPKLGRVTLIAGKNGVGKTTVLDAVQIYAARGRFDALRKLLVRRGELTLERVDEDLKENIPALDRLFHWSGGERASIAISPFGHGPVLRIEENVETEEKAIDVEFNGKRRRHTQRESALPQSWLRGPPDQDPENPAARIRCGSLGPGLVRNEDLARLWDGVTLTDDETLALKALGLVFGDRVERVAVIGEVRNGGRRVVVKLSDQAGPVPLRSLGDGATRMFGVALALAYCREGILLMDEAENGIHYSLQGKFWSLVLRAAEMHNTQVLATTHSKDCINGFAEAALNCPNVDGSLVRIGHRNGKLRTVEYSTEELDFAAEHDFEVR